jgi:hypothetical protein
MGRTSRREETMTRRVLVAVSLALLAFATQARASWTDWLVEWPPISVGGIETANAPAGPAIGDRCVVVSVNDIWSWNISGEVWCRSLTDGFGWTLMNHIDGNGWSTSVAMDAAPAMGSGFTAPYWAISDRLLYRIYYGVAGGTPEEAVAGDEGNSLSLAHYSDGTALIVYSGQDRRVRSATRNPVTGAWTTAQITNNTTGTNRWSVDAVIASDVLHITYWDDVLKAVRYARKDAQGWTFETAKNLTGSLFVSPAVAADSEGRAHIAFPGRDGLLHYLRRTAPGTWVEHTFAPPQPIANETGPVGFTVDDRKAHFVYGTGNYPANPNRELRYVNSTRLGVWGDSTLLYLQNNEPEGFRGIDLVRKNGPSPNSFTEDRLLASWSVDQFGLVGVGCADCIP